jgi:hypothetical protein
MYLLSYKKKRSEKKQNDRKEKNVNQYITKAA